MAPSGQYKSGKKKVYMTPSAAEAQGLERVSKYPKSTKYGRQNPVTARWNSEEQLVLWRTAWADTVNRSLERCGHEERIDHRSHAERGLDEQPTVHEGVIARAMERQGIVADRCELNRQIKADNALLRELKSAVRKMMDAVKNTIPAIAEAMETVRQKLIVFRYHLLHIKSGKTQITNTLQVVKPDIKRYEDIVEQLKAKMRERRALLEEKKALAAIHVFRHRDLARKIATLTEDIEELKSAKALLLNQFDCADEHGMTRVKQNLASMESSLAKLDQQEKKYSRESETALAEFSELHQQTADMDTAELDAARQALRPDQETQAVQQLRDAYGKRFDFKVLVQSQKDISGFLNEALEPVSIRQQLRQTDGQQEKRHHTRLHNRTPPPHPIKKLSVILKLTQAFTCPHRPSFVLYT